MNVPYRAKTTKRTIHNPIFLFILTTHPQSKPRTISVGVVPSYSLYSCFVRRGKSIHMVSHTVLLLSRGSQKTTLAAGSNQSRPRNAHSAIPKNSNFLFNLTMITLKPFLRILVIVSNQLVCALERPQFDCNLHSFINGQLVVISIGKMSLSAAYNKNRICGLWSNTL